MNVQTAATGARTGALYLGVIVGAIYLLILAAAPFMALRLYQLNARLTDRIVALEAKAAASPSPAAASTSSPVVLNFYQAPGSEFVQGGNLAANPGQ